MFNIAQYLEKFKVIGQGERFVKEIIQTIIKEVVGIEVDKKNIILKNGEVTFKVSPGVKNAIYIKKESILSKVKEKTSTIVCDIR